MQLRVRFIAAYTFPAGTYFRVHNLARALALRGHDVEVRAVDPDPNSTARLEVRDHVCYNIVPESRGGSRFGSASHPWTGLRRMVSRRSSPPIDVVHLFQPFLSPAMEWIIFRGARLRVFDWDDLWWGGALPSRRDGFAAAWMGTWVRFLERALPRRADLVTTCSDFLATRARTAGARDTMVVGNGCWPAPPLDRTTARTRLGLNLDAWYAGFMGRTADELAWSVAALQSVMHQHPQARLAVCGPPPHAMASIDADVRSRIDYVGVLPPDETAWFAASLNIGLLPLKDSAFNQSRFPIKFAEYLSAHVPVLMTRVGPCAIVARAWPWVTCAEPNVEQYCATFADVLTNDLAGRLPQVEYGTVANELSWAHCAALLESKYIDALRHR